MLPFENLAATQSAAERRLRAYSSKNYSIEQDDQETEEIERRVKRVPHVQRNDVEKFKVIVIGDYGTGKTSALKRFIKGYFQQHEPTMPMDFQFVNFSIDDQLIKMQAWDTSGDEKFRSITQSYYRQSQGCIAMYDITRKETFESIEQFVHNFIDYNQGKESHNIILMGCKKDKEAERQVPYEDAVKLAKKLELSAVFETSALEGENINKAFFRAIVEAYDARAKTRGELAFSQAQVNRKHTDTAFYVEQRFRKDSLQDMAIGSSSYDEGAILQKSRTQLEQPKFQLGSKNQKQSKPPAPRTATKCC